MHGCTKLFIQSALITEKIMEASSQTMLRRTPEKLSFNHHTAAEKQELEKRKQIPTGFLKEALI